jgi:hypothetical protein
LHLERIGKRQSKIHGPFYMHKKVINKTEATLLPSVSVLQAKISVSQEKIFHLIVLKRFAEEQFIFKK